MLSCPELTQQDSASTPVEKPWARQALRVPSQHGQVFCRPSWNEAAALTDRNRALLESFDPCLQGRTLKRLREWSRKEILAAAARYTSALRGEVAAAPESVDAPLIVGGHQPALFHPGVWIKNFAISRLAQETNGVGLHLIVDNDTMSGARLRLPAGTRENPSFTTLPIDADRPTQPWEDARILDRTLFASFGQRAGDAMRAWGIVPLAQQHWSDAVTAGERTGLLGEAFTSFRHRIERQWGIGNLELPFSRLCGLDPFLWFAAHLLAHLPRFQAVHNGVLAEYRRTNRVRSRTHPVAELKASDGWLEAPFWVWREGDQQRGRLLARQMGREVALSDGREEFLRMKLAPEAEACCAVEALRDLDRRGIRLRTRALTTTLFARLCLADAFLHGIGGAKYDEMTDRIATRFYRVTAPEFLTVSASVHLPIGPPHNAVAADERRLTALIRELRHNPSRHLTRGVDPGTDALIARHERLACEERDDKTTKVAGEIHKARHRRHADRFQRLKEVVAELALRTERQREAAKFELQEVQRQRAANRVLQSREYSFALFPSAMLRRVMEAFPNEV